MLSQIREGKLPAKQLGYYYEYMVEIPSANDRGPKRIIIGNGSDSFGFRLRQAGWWNSLKIQIFEQQP
jgi:hypothetical protein